MKIIKSIAKWVVIVFLGVMAFARYSETNYFYLFPMFNLSAYYRAVQHDAASIDCSNHADLQFPMTGRTTPQALVDANYAAWRTCMDAYWTKVGAAK